MVPYLVFRYLVLLPDTILLVLTLIITKQGYWYRTRVEKKSLGYVNVSGSVLRHTRYTR